MGQTQLSCCIGRDQEVSLDKDKNTKSKSTITPWTNELQDLFLKAPDPDKSLI